MRALALAAALSAIAGLASANEICRPTEQEMLPVLEVMTRVKDPDLASLGADQPSLAGCGVWSLEIAADGKVKSVQVMRLQGPDALRGAIEPWLKTLKFEVQAEDWSGVMPVTLQASGKK
jgi:hypothetical protein